MPDPILDALTAARERFLEGLEVKADDSIERMILAYRQIRARLTADLDVTLAAIASGEPTRTQIAQNSRTLSLLAQVDAEMSRFAIMIRNEAVQLQIAGIDAGIESFSDQMQTLLGRNPARIGVGYDVLPRDAIRQTVAALGEDSPLYALLSTFGREARESWRREIVSGLAAGDNPRAVARRLASVTDGGMIRASRIARTEMMRGYREAHHENYRANSHVVTGWMWIATFQPRTCPACLSQHGKIFPLTTKLVDHPNGRCTSAPVTKTWSELGLPDLPETSLSVRPVQSGEDWLRTQPAATQVAILGARGRSEWLAGRVALGDFVGVNKSRVWGDSINAVGVETAISRARSRADQAPARKF